MANKTIVQLDAATTLAGTEPMVVWQSDAMKQVDVADLPFSTTSHTHDGRYYTETEVDTALALKSNTTHDHDDRYFTISQVTALLADKADETHTHSFSSFNTASGTWTLDAPSGRSDYQGTLTFTGPDDPTDVTVGIDTPANLVKGDAWRKTSGYIV